MSNEVAKIKLNNAEVNVHGPFQSRLRIGWKSGKSMMGPHFSC